MKTILRNCNLLFAILLLTGYTAMAQKTPVTNIKNNPNATQMKTYLIEREIPDAGKLTPEQLKAISQTSCSVLKEMGPKIQWIQSYVVGDKIFCVYKAQNEELLRLGEEILASKQAQEISLIALRHQIEMVRAAIQEMDDEEVLLLSVH